MVIVKRLYTFMLQRFLPLLAMTFCICLFIVMMQFLWKYIDDLVGKGLAISVIGELFFYAALSMVPTALPLAVLLASLMTFGNLGEKFELTALKAAGISLFQIMRPLIVIMVLIAIGAFFFQNNVLPIAQTKMYTLLFSMRQKSPEVEIPVKAFYNDIPGMNIFVEKKNPETGMLYDLIIYDVTQGLDNSRVILADSGRMNFTEDKTHLFLHLFRGEMFENIRNSALGATSKQFMPFRRESFSDKQIYLTFDANFSRMDESNIRSQYVGKNVVELKHSIDSIQAIVDSIGNNYGRELKTTSYVHVPYYSTTKQGDSVVTSPTPPLNIDKPLNLDTVFSSPSPDMARQYVTQALQRAQQQHDNYEFRSMVITDQQKLKNRHGIEMHRKFTLSFACLIFFFIGAPLGAIIKKGGIGTPLVISVLLFIFYYIIDNAGYKMARDSKLEVWQGIWLSSAVLVPLGVFFTWKAVGDSDVFNADAYARIFAKLTGKNPTRSIFVKEVIINETETPVVIEKLTAFLERLNNALSSAKKRSLSERILGRPSLKPLTDELNEIDEYISNTRDKKLADIFNSYPQRVTYRNIEDVKQTTEILLSYLDDNTDSHQVILDALRARRHRKSSMAMAVSNLRLHLKNIFSRKKKTVSQTIQTDNKPTADTQASDILTEGEGVSQLPHTETLPEDNGQ